MADGSVACCGHSDGIVRVVFLWWIAVVVRRTFLFHLDCGGGVAMVDCGGGVAMVDCGGGMADFLFW